MICLQIQSLFQPGCGIPPHNGSPEDLKEVYHQIMHQSFNANLYFDSNYSCCGTLNMHPSLYGLDQNWQAKYKEQCQLNSMGGEECMKHK